MRANVDAIPFVLGLVAILVQPALEMIWLARFEILYRARDQALEGAAKWIADVSAFMPTALLTLFGMALILDAAPDDQRPWFLLAVAIACAVTATFFVLMVKKRDPEKETRGPYSILQYWLILLNITGIATALAIE